MKSIEIPISGPLPSVEDALHEVSPLPHGVLFLGVGIDNIPVLLNMNDRAAWPIAVIAHDLTGAPEDLVKTLKIGARNFRQKIEEVGYGLEPVGKQVSPIWDEDAAAHPDLLAKFRVKLFGPIESRFAAQLGFDASAALLPHQLAMREGDTWLRFWVLSAK